MYERPQYVTLGMSRNPVATVPALIAAALLLGCGDNDTDGRSASDEGIDFDAFEDPATRGEQPGDVLVDDPFLAQLDHSWIGPVDGGFVIAGYDQHANMIGSISVYEIGSNQIQITHEYPRPCDDAVPQGAEDCADVLQITATLTEGWADVWQSATPAGLFTDRAHAILAKLPPETGESRFRCALKLAAAASACAGLAAGPVAAPGCFYLANEAFCECEVYQRQFPKVDWSEICD